MLLAQGVAQHEVDVGVGGEGGGGDCHEQRRRVETEVGGHVAVDIGGEVGREGEGEEQQPDEQAAIGEVDHDGEVGGGQGESEGEGGDAADIDQRPPQQPPDPLGSQSAATARRVTDRRPATADPSANHRADPARRVTANPSADHRADSAAAKNGAGCGFGGKHQHGQQ